MFKSFALAKPFCRRIKVPRGTDRLWGCVAPDGVGWRRVAGRQGTARADGVDWRIYFPHDVRCVRPGACQPDVGHLDHAGASRRRPDDQPWSIGLRVCRYHQPHHPAPDPDHCAGRAGDGDCPHAQPARNRFRDHRHERGRHAAVATVPALPRGHHRRIAADRQYRRLCRARRAADAPALADRGSHRPHHQHRATRPLHVNRPRPLVLHSRASA